MPTNTRRHALAGATITACLLTLTACNGSTGPGTDSVTETVASSSVPSVSVPPSSCTPTPSPAASSSSNPTSSSPATSPASAAVKLDDPKEVAIKVMDLFARPDEPERRWFSELRPYLEDQYAENAEYIDPARIPFNKSVSGPVMGGDSDNAQVATADFKTNGGPWYVELHQDVPGGDWLVGGIHEQMRQ